MNAVRDAVWAQVYSTEFLRLMNIGQWGNEWDIERARELAAERANVAVVDLDPTHLKGLEQ